MDPKDFVAPAAGRVIRAESGYWAFVPSSLPPAIEWDTELVLALSRADSALSRLSGVGSQLPNSHLLIDPYARREAVLSSRIEGTQASLSDLLLDEIAPERVEASRDDVREVRNYVAALEHGIKRLSGLPLSLRLIRETHEILMAGVRGEHATPGEFRRSQNWIGRPGSTIDTAAYVPPPPDEMNDALSEWERFLHDRESLPDLIQCALVHEQFEAIHPFLDGNGRIGRLLITLFLIERQRLSQPLLYLSAYFEANKSDYYDALQRVRTHADWRGWLLFFLAGVAQVASRAAEQAGELAAMRERYRALVGDKAKPLALVDEVFRSPIVNAASAIRRLGVSDPTARAAISALEAVGLLEEYTGRSWGRVWIARPVMEVLERPL
ncbi:MAG: Fic family protein [Coriobacteriia bacterium]|nr:Fic family protein [Coriobacteriia bacterium]